MNHFLKASAMGLVCAAFVVIVIIVARAFLLWDLWPDTHRYLLQDESDAASFYFLLRLLGGSFFLIGFCGYYSEIIDGEKEK